MNIKEVIKKGLEGYPVKLRYGHKAYIRYNEQELEVSHPLTGFYIEEKGGARDIVWTTEGKYFIFPFDIVGLWEKDFETPLEFEHWDLLVDEIKYIAKDKCGEWYGYKIPPTLEYDNAFFRSNCDYYEYLNNRVIKITFPNCNWEDSLIERPKDIK